jgi:hypothetical protein
MLIAIQRRSCLSSFQRRFAGLSGLIAASGTPEGLEN